MTDSTNSPEYTAARADVSSQIDALVNAASESADRNPASIDGGGTRSNVKVNSDGTVEFTGENSASSRIPDDGTNLDVAMDQHFARVNELQLKLDEVSYHPKTGAVIIHHQGAAREAIKQQIEQMKISAVYQAQRYDLIRQQRAQDAANKAIEQQEALTRLRITGGDPRKQARYDELLGDEELRTAVKAEMARRFERTQR